MCVFIFTYIHTYIHTHIYQYLYIYTHIHIYTYWLSDYLPLVFRRCWLRWCTKNQFWKTCTQEILGFIMMYQYVNGNFRVSPFWHRLLSWLQSLYQEPLSLDVHLHGQVAGSSRWHYILTHFDLPTGLKAVRILVQLKLVVKNCRVPLNWGQSLRADQEQRWSSCMEDGFDGLDWIGLFWTSDPQLPKTSEIPRTFMEHPGFLHRSFQLGSWIMFEHAMVSKILKNKPLSCPYRVISCFFLSEGLQG